MGSNGNVSGQSVRVAGGVDGAVTAALLQVDPGASITATASGGSIVLATDTVGAVSIANGGRRQELCVRNAPGQRHQCRCRDCRRGTGQSGGFDLGHARRHAVLDRARGRRILTTAGGSVTAGRNYAASARSVTLGTAATTVTQAAGGSVTVNASAGNLTGLGTLTLQSNTDGAGAEALDLAASGLIDLGANSSLIGGTAANRSNVLLTTGSSITAGNVTALALLRSGNPTDLTLPGNLTLGNVNVASNLRITSTGGTIQTGDLTSTGAIRLDAQAAGDVVVGTVNATNAIDLLARNNIRLVSAGSTAGSIALSAQTGSVSVALPSPINDGRPLPNFGRANLTAAAANQTITVAANAGSAQLGTLSAGAGAGALGANQIQVSAGTVDVASANAVNGHVHRQLAAGTIPAGALSAGSATALGDVIANAPNSADDRRCRERDPRLSRHRQRRHARRGCHHRQPDREGRRHDPRQYRQRHRAWCAHRPGQ